ncbi:hypothetical protein [Capnocytophaga cynodegmi]|uniref:hypothetical protein n=1 Tax=Capnocytophaga cynodegmi TaxID=28189 RepID=UPI00385B0BCD
MSKLEKIIMEYPYKMEKEFLQDKKLGPDIIEINDKIYREQKSIDRKFSWFLLGLVFICVSPLGYVSFSSEESLFTRIIFLLFWIGSSLAAGCYPFYALYKELILNRETGMISVPRLWSKKNLEIPFDEGYGFIRAVSSTDGVFSFSLTFFQEGKRDTFGTIAESCFPIDEYWAFVVWYMDKNRPLPPGTAFDPYREADYQRRKAEGFPKPLFYSYLETPEATKTQQRTRWKIGGW